MLRSLNRLADRLIDLSAFIGTLGLIAEVGVILVDVIGRAFGAPLRGAQDISTMAMVLVVFGGMALCDKTGGHISVDLFEKSFPRSVVIIGDLMSALIGAVIFILIAWTVWQSAELSRMLHLSTNIINLPKAWFQYAMVIMSLITALGMLLRAAGALAGRTIEHKDIT